MLSCYKNYDRLENARSGLNPYLIQWQTKLTSPVQAAVTHPPQADENHCQHASNILS